MRNSTSLIPRAAVVIYDTVYHSLTPSHAASYPTLGSHPREVSVASTDHRCFLFVHTCIPAARLRRPSVGNCVVKIPCSQELRSDPCVRNGIRTRDLRGSWFRIQGVTTRPPRKINIAVKKKFFLTSTHQSGQVRFPLSHE